MIMIFNVECNDYFMTTLTFLLLDSENIKYSIKKTPMLDEGH